MMFYCFHFLAIILLHLQVIVLLIVISTKYFLWIRTYLPF